MSFTTTSVSTRATLKAESAPSPSNNDTSTVSASTSAQNKDMSQTATANLEQKEHEEDLDIYDEIELEDMTYDPQLRMYHYPCPCGDRFEISMDDMKTEDGQKGNDIAVCPGCSLMIRVIFDVEDLEHG